jgi:hypothetical protein
VFLRRYATGYRLDNALNSVDTVVGADIAKVAPVRRGALSGFLSAGPTDYLGLRNIRAPGLSWAAESDFDAAATPPRPPSPGRARPGRVRVPGHMRRL